MSVAALSPLLLRDVEVAEQLRISRAQVWRIIAANELKVVHIGRSVRVTADELRRYVDALAS